MSFKEWFVEEMYTLTKSREDEIETLKDQVVTLTSQIGVLTNQVETLEKRLNEFVRLSIRLEANMHAKEIEERRNVRY